MIKTIASALVAASLLAAPAFAQGTAPTTVQHKAAVKHAVKTHKATKHVALKHRHHAVTKHVVLKHHRKHVKQVKHHVKTIRHQANHVKHHVKKAG